MFLKHLLPILVIATIATTFNAQAQYHHFQGFFVDSIYVMDDIGSPVQGLAFGNDSGATYGLDTINDCNPTVIEIGGLPAPPSGLNAVWAPLKNRPAASYGEVDHYHLDVRAWPTNVSMKDTFLLRLTDDNGAAVVLRWNHTQIAENCDSAFLTYRYSDLDGNPYRVIINMQDGSIGDSACISAEVMGFGLTSGGAYIYKYGLKTSCYCGIIKAANDPCSAGIDDLPAPATPTKYALLDNYPNPFNPTTTIGYQLPKESLVTLKVLNIVGQTIAVLRDHAVEPPGEKQAEWDALGFSSGVYFYRLEAINLAQPAKSFFAVRKMVLVK